jgi:hypothetical protein
VITAVLLIASSLEAAANSDIAVLESVRVLPGGVRMELSRRVEPQLYTLLNPSRLVIDFDRTEHAGPGGSRPGRGALFSAARSSQYQGGVTPVARVVLDLNANAAHRSFWNGRHLTVLLEPDIENDLRDALAPLAPAIFRTRPSPGRMLPPVRNLVRRFQGLLRDREGRPLSGNYLLRFSAEDWSESLYVKAQDGKFTARLGAQSPLPERYREAPLAASVAPPVGTGWSVTTR